MEEEMGDMVEYTFTAVEIDLDYEFDAARCFDFSREESLAEARQAEVWFQTAASYPPSPFVKKLVARGDIMLENVNTSPKPKDAETTTLPGRDSDIVMDPDVSVMDVNSRGIFTNLPSGSPPKFQNQPQVPTGLTSYNHMIKYDTKAKTKSFGKPSFPRTSTLMKPTASQLAKQNQPRQMGDSRFQKLVEKSNKSSDNPPCLIESQAAKRQKLEGGHLRKVADTKQQINLVHKAPKRDVTMEGLSVVHAKLRLTIPREPHLQTAHRAQRMRPKPVGEVEHATSTVRKFRTLPVNKKILEAPSFIIPGKTTPQLPEFQGLRKPNGNSVAECGNRGSRRVNLMDVPKQERCGENHSFKARPLNKKIFSSKGDVGVFRNIKRETTVPMEFNFQAAKRVQHDPPVELFNKLSLTSELQTFAESQLKLSRPTVIPSKGFKENRLGSFKQEHEMRHLEKENPPPRFGVKQIPCGSDGRITNVRPLHGMNGGLGIH